LFGDTESVPKKKVSGTVSGEPKAFCFGSPETVPETKGFRSRFGEGDTVPETEVFGWSKPFVSGPPKIRIFRSETRFDHFSESTAKTHY
jgi:hypothetical protein